MNEPKAIFKELGVFIGQPIRNKKIVLKYLRAFKPYWVTSGFVFDRVKNEELKGYYNAGYEYDGFFLNEEHIYHFEKYDMPLNEEFVKFVFHNKNAT